MKVVCSNCDCQFTAAGNLCRADRDRMQLQVETDELGSELEQLAKAKVSN